MPACENFIRPRRLVGAVGGNHRRTALGKTMLQRVAAREPWPQWPPSPRHKDNPSQSADRRLSRARIGWASDPMRSAVSFPIFSSWTKHFLSPVLTVISPFAANWKETSCDFPSVDAKIVGQIRHRPREQVNVLRQRGGHERQRQLHARPVERINRPRRQHFQALLLQRRRVRRTLRP